MTVVEVDTEVVVTVNVAVLEPAVTVTVVGTEALVLDDERLTVRPPVGAFPLRFNVPVDDAPPTSEVGERVRLVRLGGTTVSVVEVDEVPSAALIVAEAEVDTGDVVIVNVAVLLPGATVTVAGVTALATLEERETANPAAGAGPFNVTVPVEETPPVTLEGETEID